MATDSFEYYTPAPGWKVRNILDFNGLISAAGMHLAYGSKKLPPIVPINHTTGNGNEGQDKGQTDGVQDQCTSEVGSDHFLNEDRKKRSKSKRQKPSRKSRDQKTGQPYGDKSLTNGTCDLVSDALDEPRRKRRTSDASYSSGSSSGEESAGDTETITSLSSTRSLWEEDRDDVSDLAIGMTLEMLEKAIEAYRAAGSNTEHNDPRSLVSMVCRVFSEWEVLGNSFTVVSASPDDETETPTGASLIVDFPSLRTAYALLLSLEPRDIFTSALVNAMELLLAKMEMNVDGVFPSDYYSDGIEDDEVGDGDAKWRIAQEWCRAMMCILECPLVCGFDGNESVDGKDVRRVIDEGLMKKVVGVLYKIGSRKGSFLRKLVVEKFSRLVIVIIFILYSFDDSFMS